MSRLVEGTNEHFRGILVNNTQIITAKDFAGWKPRLKLISAGATSTETYPDADILQEMILASRLKFEGDPTTEPLFLDARLNRFGYELQTPDGGIEARYEVFAGSLMPTHGRLLFLRYDSSNPRIRVSHQPNDGMTVLGLAGGRLELTVYTTMPHADAIANPQPPVAYRKHILAQR